MGYAFPPLAEASTGPHVAPVASRTIEVEKKTWQIMDACLPWPPAHKEINSVSV